MADYTKPQDLVDFTTIDEQKDIATEEMLCEVLGRIITKLNELDTKVAALESKKK